MKAVLLVLMLGVIGWALQGDSLAPVPGASSSPAACTIAGVPDGEAPELHASPIAELLPTQMPKLRKAYFSMGCFWGSEAMLASCPGVMFTRVGFTGGTLPNPSYSAIGDHVETVEVSFDPDQVSYIQLLDHFWSHHNAHAKPIFRQYASAIFTEDEGQEQAARKMRENRRSSSGDRLLTAIKPLQTFYPADAGHQKYYLSQDPELLERLPRHGEQKLDTRLATKLNALAGHAGQRQHIQNALTELGLSEASTEALLQRADWPAP
jgi:methionine-S-sulfoxide reductase